MQPTIHFLKVRGRIPVFVLTELLAQVAYALCKGEGRESKSGRRELRFECEDLNCEGSMETEFRFGMLGPSAAGTCFSTEVASGLGVAQADFILDVSRYAALSRIPGDNLWVPLPDEAAAAQTAASLN